MKKKLHNSRARSLNKKIIEKLTIGRFKSFSSWFHFFFFILTLLFLSSSYAFYWATITPSINNSDFIAYISAAIFQIFFYPSIHPLLFPYTITRQTLTDIPQGWPIYILIYDWLDSTPDCTFLQFILIKILLTIMLITVCS